MAIKTEREIHLNSLPTTMTAVIVVVVVDDGVRTKDVSVYALPVRPICPEMPWELTAEVAQWCRKSPSQLVQCQRNPTSAPVYEVLLLLMWPMFFQRSLKFPLGIAGTRFFQPCHTTNSVKTLNGQFWFIRMIHSLFFLNTTVTSQLYVLLF